MSENYNFRDKARLPVIPLSYEHKYLAVPKEFILNYKTGSAYVCLEDGNVINICTSEETMKIFSEYLKNNPDILADAIIITNDGNFTLTETLEKIYQFIDEVNGKTYKYAGSESDGGPANVANKVAGVLTVSGSGLDTTFDGSTNTTLDLSVLFSKFGGQITGDVTLDKKLIITRNEMFGPELPENGTEGQVFFLLQE